MQLPLKYFSGRRQLTHSFSGLTSWERECSECIPPKHKRIGNIPKQNSWSFPNLTVSSVTRQRFSVLLESRPKRLKLWRRNRDARVFFHVHLIVLTTSLVSELHGATLTEVPMHQLAVITSAFFRECSRKRKRSRCTFCVRQSGGHGDEHRHFAWYLQQVHSSTMSIEHFWFPWRPDLLLFDSRLLQLLSAISHAHFWFSSGRNFECDKQKCTSGKVANMTFNAFVVWPKNLSWKWMSFVRLTHRLDVTKWDNDWYWVKRMGGVYLESQTPRSHP